VRLVGEEEALEAEEEEAESVCILHSHILFFFLFPFCSSHFRILPQLLCTRSPLCSRFRSHIVPLPRRDPPSRLHSHSHSAIALRIALRIRTTFDLDSENSMAATPQSQSPLAATLAATRLQLTGANCCYTYIFTHGYIHINAHTHHYISECVQ